MWQYMGIWHGTEMGISGLLGGEELTHITSTSPTVQPQTVLSLTFRITMFLTSFQQHDLIILRQLHESWDHLGKFYNLLDSQGDFISNLHPQISM